MLKWNPWISTHLHALWVMVLLKVALRTLHQLLTTSHTWSRASLSHARARKMYVSGVYSGWTRASIPNAHPFKLKAPKRISNHYPRSMLCLAAFNRNIVLRAATLPNSVIDAWPPAQIKEVSLAWKSSRLRISSRAHIWHRMESSWGKVIPVWTSKWARLRHHKWSSLMIWFARLIVLRWKTLLIRPKTSQTSEGATLNQRSRNQEQLQVVLSVLRAEINRSVTWWPPATGNSVTNSHNNSKVRSRICQLTSRNSQRRYLWSKYFHKLNNKIRGPWPPKLHSLNIDNHLNHHKLPMASKGTMKA